MSATIQQITLTAPDISCEHCTRAIEGVVSALDGVQDVNADIASKSVNVAFDPRRVTQTQIEAAMNEEGYPVTK